MPERKPIFYDQERRRWRRTRRVLEITGGLFTLILVVFVVNVFRKPELPDILSAATHWNIHAVPAKLKAKPATRGRKRKVAALGKVPQNYDPLRAAFYVADDPTSLASLKLHYHDIDLLIPEALHASSPDGRLDIEQDPKLLSWMQANTIELPIMSMVNNYDGKNLGHQRNGGNAGKSHGARTLVEIACGFCQRATPVRHRGGFRGGAAKQPAGFLAFHPRSGDRHARRQPETDGCAARRGLELRLQVSGGAGRRRHPDELRPALSDLGRRAHRAAGLVRTQHRKHRQNCARAKKSSWASRTTATTGRQNPRKVPHPIAQALTFQQGIITAVESESDVTFDPDSLNPHYSYEDEQNQVHNVWMLDGVTAYNELRAAERAGVRGTALWRLGMEDPSLWFIWDATHSTDAIRAKLEEVPPGYDLILEGAGDIWRITATPQSGRRSFRLRCHQRRLRRRVLPELPAFLAHRADGRGPAQSGADVSTTAPTRNGRRKFSISSARKMRRPRFSPSASPRIRIPS